MNTILYVIIFIMGTVFGSFYTLAVYRIPQKIDIVKTHSFCPNCNRKLGFFELIPVLSYIFLGGKCKQCGQGIRPRYFILEITSGITFVLIAIALKIDANNLNIARLIYVAFLVLYLVAIFLIAGIDKENKKIEKSVLYYALGIAALYIIYLCIIDKASIYRYAMYLIALVILLIIDNLILRNKAKNSYAVSILILIIVMEIMTGEIITISSCAATIVTIILAIIMPNIKNKLNKSKKEKVTINNISIGYLLGITNIVCLILSLFMNNWSL